VCRTWHAYRFKLGYEKLTARYEAGILADTFECTPTWETVSDTYRRVRRALTRFGVVGAHVGMDLEHPYLYFTFALGDRSRAAHDEAWADALGACIASGARTNHHHGIGKRKAGRRGELVPYANGRAWHLRAQETKSRMDPHRILNPTNLV
jgi:FAD/FMN-containing dehydrogenase